MNTVILKIAITEVEADELLAFINDPSNEEGFEDFSERERIMAVLGIQSDVCVNYATMCANCGDHPTLTAQHGFVVDARIENRTELDDMEHVDDDL